jgi:hypothetical protein
LLLNPPRDNACKAVYMLYYGFGDWIWLEKGTREYKAVRVWPKSSSVEVECIEYYV